MEVIDKLENIYSELFFFSFYLNEYPCYVMARMYCIAYIICISFAYLTKLSFEGEY